MKDKLFNWFKNTHYGILLKECYNSFDHTDTNIYHREITVLDHIEMVMNVVERKFKKDHDYINLLVGAMLHDIGKIYARREDNEKELVYFYNHEHIGFYHASQVLEDLSNSDIFDIKESKDKRYIKIDSYNLDKDKVLKIVCFHDIYKYTAKDVVIKHLSDSVLLLKFSMCDNYGRISEQKRNYGHDYISDIKLSNRILIEKRKHSKELIFIIGLPGSGKSTYIEKYLKNSHLLCRDYFIKNNPFVSGTYTENWNYLTTNDLQKEIDKMYNSRFLDLLRDDNVDSIVIDKVNLNKKSRTKYLTGNLEGFKKSDKEILNNIKKKAIILTTPYNICVERNENREEKKINEKTLNNFIQNSCIPDYLEFDEILFSY